MNLTAAELYGLIHRSAPPALAAWMDARRALLVQVLESLLVEMQGSPRTPIYFASGTNAVGEVRGFAKIGQPIGVTAEQFPPSVEAELIKLAGTGLPVFVDSGAFSEVTFGPTGPVVVKPLDAAHWHKVLALYKRLGTALGSQLYVVAPDQVGNQQVTLDRLARAGGDLRDLERMGVNVIVPLQQGVMSLAEMEQAALARIGLRRWVAGIPSKKDATPSDAVLRYVQERKPQAIHLLGLGPSSPRAPELLERIRQISPSTRVSMDSVLVRAHVGKTGGPGGGPRKLTTALEGAREEVQQHRWGGYPVSMRDSEDRPLPDYTDVILEPSEWTNRGALQRIAQEGGIPEEDLGAWMADPDGYIADLEELPWLLEQALDVEWGRAMERAEGPSRKEHAIVRAFTKNPAPAAEGSRVGPRAWLFDAEGRRYSVTYQLLPLVVEDRASSKPGAVLASNLPQSFRPSPGYPPALQARDLAEFAEREKIKRIALGLDPARLLVQHADPTLGPPVVWEGPPPAGGGFAFGPSKGQFYPLGGNSRTLALATAPEDAYAGYLAAVRDDWPGLAPTGAPPSGTRWGVFRVVHTPEGQPLTLEQAVQLAGASQAATAGAESVLGRATSVARGLGLTDLNQLPPLTGWSGPVHRDNIAEFRKINSVWWQAVLDRLDPARAQSITSRPEATAELVRQVMSLALPEEVRRQGLGNRQEEEALLSALPALITLHQRVEAGLTKPEWDLLPRLGVVAQGAREISRQRLSISAALSAWSESRRQKTLMGGAATIFDELDPLGLLFALALKQAATRADPEQAMAAYLEPYFAAAVDETRSAKATDLFGGSSAPKGEPADLLAKALGKQAQEWEGKQGTGERRENPRRQEISAVARTLLAGLVRAPALLVWPLGEAPNELLLNGYAKVLAHYPAGLSASPTVRLGITQDGQAALTRWRADEARADLAAQRSWI